MANRKELIISHIVGLCNTIFDHHRDAIPQHVTARASHLPDTPRPTRVARVQTALLLEAVRYQSHVNGSNWGPITRGLERIFWTPCGVGGPSEKCLRVAFSCQKSTIRRIP